MTDQQHPITPPPSAIDYLNRAVLDGRMGQWDSLQAAYRAGADAELEACCEVLAERSFVGQATILREWRRPKPLSVAEQATAKLDIAVIRGDCITTSDATPSLRAALKRLQELEQGNG